MANQENIEKHQWQPGQSGNPRGRPKGSQNSKTILNKYLDLEVEITNPVTKKKEKVTAKEAIIIAAMGQAMKGNIHAFNAVFDRSEGRVNQRVEVTGNDGGPVQTENVTNVDYSKLSTDALKEIVAARNKNTIEQPQKTTKAKNSVKRKGEEDNKA